MKIRKLYADLIVIVIIGLFIFITHKYSRKREAYIMENGVWTIFTMGNITPAATGGNNAPIYYKYQGYPYKGGITFGNEISRDRKGSRFYMILLPEKPEKKVLTLDPVPEWFTIDAPYNGWPEKPTEKELLEYMEMDSVARGLKMKVMYE